jgi:hypothetical protein
MNAQNLIVAEQKRKPGVQDGRLSAKMLHAVTLYVEKGLSGDDSARAAGMFPSAFWRAWARPHVKARAAQIKAAFLERMATKEQDLKARSIDVIEELMDPKQPPAIRLKAVELLRREARQPTVAIQQNFAAPGGYVYPTADTASKVAAESAKEIKGLDE